MYLDKNNGLHHPFDSQFALTCPHCLTYSHLTAVSIPRYAQLQQYKPKQTGIVYRCDACNSPVFLKFDIKSYGEDRVDFSSKFSEMERPRESFNFSYLPEDVETMFKEALSCYANNCLNAFASMCRRSARMVFRDLGETGKLRIFDQFNDVKDMTALDNETFSVVKSVVFDSDELPILDAAQAGLLLEMMKDTLYQTYIRKGKLQQALMMRRYFLEDSSTNITPLQKQKG
jgi:hypothetical protein